MLKRFGYEREDILICENVHVRTLQCLLNAKHSVTKRCIALTAVTSVKELQLQHRTYVLDTLLSTLKKNNSTEDCLSTVPINSTELAANTLKNSQTLGSDNTSNSCEENTIFSVDENTENKILFSIEKCTKDIILLYETIEIENKLIDKNENDLRGIWFHDPSKININEELKKLQDEFDEKINLLEIKHKSHSKQILGNCKKEKIIIENNIRKYGKENLIFNSPLTKYLKEKLDENTDLDEFSLSEVILQENNSSDILCEKINESEYNLFCSEKKDIALIVSLALSWSPDFDFREMQDLLHKKIVTRMIHDCGE